MKRNITSYATGTYQSGTYTQLASTQSEAENIQLVSGVIYEHRIMMSDTITTSMMGTIQNAILGIQQTFGIIEVTYWKAEGTEIVYQFRFTQGTSTAQVIPVLWAVIAIVLIALASYVLMWKVFKVDPLGIDTVTKLIPGLIVTGIGGVMASALPGKSKIAGLVPIGIGASMMLSTVMGEKPPEPPPKPPPNQYGVTILSVKAKEV